MKIFFNHIPKCGGTSIFDWLRDNSDYKVIRIMDERSKQSLQSRIDEFQNTQNIIIGGHTQGPGKFSDSIKNEFWSKVYQLADVRFSILRNPIQRFHSYLKYKCAKGESDFFLFSSSHKHLIESMQSLGICLPPHSLSSVLTTILPENFLLSYPFNNYLSCAINDQVSCLGWKYPRNILLPLSLTHDKRQRDEYRLGLCLAGTTLGNSFPRPAYSLFCLEDLDKFILHFKNLGVISCDSAPIKMLNQSKDSIGISTCDLDAALKAKILSEYPESFELWKKVLVNPIIP